MYGVIRFIVCSILILILALVVKKKTNKKIFAFCLLLCIAFCVSIWFIPFENLFVAFDSPEDVFDYMGNGSVVSTVEGVDSVAMITKEDNNSFSTFFALKKDNKYKIATTSADKVLYTKHHDSLHFYIYQIKGTNDYYLLVWGTVSDEINISDSQNTDFEIMYEDFSDEKKIINALGRLDSIEDYSCFIGDYEINFD